MRQFILAASVMLSCAASMSAPAFAQDAAGAQFHSLELIEQRRPVIEKRKLTNEEKTQAKKLIAEINKKPTHELLDQLRPLVVAGDREAMKAMYNGYKTVPDNLKGYDKGSPVWALRGLWAMQLWKDGERSKELSRELADCLSGVNGRVKGNCGFNADIPISNTTFQAHWTGKGGPPKDVTFEEYRFEWSTPGEDRKRFEAIEARYKNKQSVADADYYWAEGWAKKQGAAMYDRWQATGAAGIMSNNREVAALNDKLRAESAQNKLLTQWTELDTKRQAAAKEGRKLSDEDYGKFASYSFQLGGKYLEPYASENYLVQQTAIDSLCRNKPGAVCDRQRQIFETLAKSARDEALNRELALRNLKLGGSSVDVRTYDQNGNYLGTTSMPQWQADILRGN